MIAIDQHRIDQNIKQEKVNIKMAASTAIPKEEKITS